MARRGAAKLSETGLGERSAPNWEDLRIALAVARARSLARAADALGIDPATVSRRVAAAEARLGAILFVRSTVGIDLTDAGRALVDRATEMEIRVERLREQVTDRGAISGVVRIFCAPWTASRLAASGVPSLRATHPGIELHLVATQQGCGVASGEPSIGLWFGKATRLGDFAIRLGDVPFAVYTRTGAAPDNDGLALAYRNDDVSAHLTAPQGDAVALAPGMPLHNAPTFAMSASDPLVLREAAHAGLGAALLPMCLGEGDPLLENRSPDGKAAKCAMMLHANPDIIQLRRVQAVIETIRRRFDVLFGARSQLASSDPRGCRPARTENAER